MSRFFPRLGLAVFLAALMALLTLGPARAQSVTSPAGAQVFSSGQVHTILVQPDGKVLMGGDFSSINGVPRNNIVRLNVDGSVDSGFNPNASDPVLSLALDPAGNVYLAGTFREVGGQERAGLAKVSASGVVDKVWNPNPRRKTFLANQTDPGSVFVVGYDPATGALFAGGLFDVISGQPRAFMAKLSTTGSGTVDPLWTISASTFFVNAMVFDGAGNMFVGGFFSEIGGVLRPNVAKVSTAGFGAVDPNWNPAPSNEVRALVLDGNNLYLGGDFVGLGMAAPLTPRNRLARVSATGTGAVDGWNPGVSGEAVSTSVDSLALDGTSLYVGGSFGTIAGVSRNNAAKVSTVTAAADATWNPNTNAYVGGLAVSAGQVFAAGQFTMVAGSRRYGFAALNKTNGAVDSAWPAAYRPGIVRATVRDGSGRTIVGGGFSHAGSGPAFAERSNLVRFNADGSVDATWDPSPNGGVQALVPGPSGALFVGGGFSSIGGASRNNLALVSSAGTATTFNPNANGAVNALALDQSGNIYAGGGFTTIGGQTRSRIAKLLSTGAADATWNPNAANPSGDLPAVRALALDTSNWIYVGGTFTSIGGQAVSSIARLSTTGAGLADATWRPTSDASAIQALALDASGNVFVGGVFGSIGGQSRRNLAKLSTSTGAPDPSWSPSVQLGVSALALDGIGSLFVGMALLFDEPLTQSALKVSVSGAGAADPTWLPAPDGFVQSIVLDGAGNVCLGGSFTTIVGQPRSGYACVAPTAPPTLPQFTSGGSTAFIVARPESFSFNVVAAGAPRPTVSVSGTLPSGVSFNPATGMLTGIPAPGTIGSYPLTFTATNSVGSTPQSFVLTIAPREPDAPSLNTVAAGNGVASVAFSAASHDGGRQIVKHTARCTSGSETRTAEGTTLTLLVGNLNNNTTYSCTVTTTNTEGESWQSNSGNVTPCPGCAAPMVPGSLALGGQSMGTTSPPSVLTITNPSSATASVTVTTVAATGPFGVTHNCGTLAAGASCTVSVTFSPETVAGALNSTVTVTGTLTITTSAGNLTVSLSGTAEKSLIAHYYRSILRRAPDTGGHAFWTAEAARVAALGANVSEVWFALSGSFYRSAEYVAQNRNTTEYVRDLYNTFYNRAADDGGLNFWAGQINSGLPREVVLISFMFSTEFTNFTQALFGNTAARAEINTVVDFYRGLLGRLPDDGGFANWRDRFRIAQCQGPAAAAAVTAEVESISSAFALSPEYGARARDNTQYVADLYNAFLRRGGDLGGVQHWINQVASGAMTREQVRVEFRNSAEFQARVNAIIAQGCLP